MNNILKVAVMLTAYDAMSREVQSAVGKSKKELQDLQNYSKKMFAEGLGLTAAGSTGFAFLGRATKDFADLQEGALDLRSTLTKDGGLIDEVQFNKLNKIAEQLGNKLPGTTSDFHAMFTAMINGGLNAENILSGVGKSAAYMAIQLKMPYDAAGKFAAKMKEATGVADEDMMDFLDTIARTKQVGVDADEMQYAFARSTGALKLMNIQGLEASKTMAIVDAMLIKSGQSGETIGTGMTSIFKAMLNPAAMGKLNSVAQQFGINMEFMDKKTGKFLGIENMMAQFDKMKNLTAEQKNMISTAFLGAGADSNFMNILADKGSAGFNSMTRAMSEQATLTDKVELKTAGLNSQYEAFQGTITNIFASIGKTMEPTLTGLIKLFNWLATSIQNFVSLHPRITQLIVTIVAFTSAALMIAGVIRIIQGVIAIMKVLNIVMAMNPFILIAAAAILAVSLIITYWEPIVDFFKRTWRTILNVFLLSNPFGWLILVVYNTIRLIRKHFTLAPWFKKVLNDAKDVVLGALTWWYVDLPKMFFNAGSNIAKSIWNGIKSIGHKPIEALKGIVQSMRDFLPFSPAKTGPFKDLHKIKIIETIAGTIKGTPLVKAMSNVASQGVKAMTGTAPRLAMAGGGGITVVYNPTIHIGAGSNKEDFMSMLKTHSAEILKMIERETKKNSRTQF